MKNDAKKVILNILPFISLGLLLLFWVSFSTANPKLLATPKMVWERLIRMFENPISNMNLFGHVFASMKRILIALGFAITLGILIGFVMARNWFGNATVGTIFNFIKPIPPLAWVPMITVWFGIGELSKVILVWRGGVVPITENTYTGVKYADQSLIDVGRVARANKRQIFTQIILPGALPAIFAGFKNSLSVCLMVVLAAEMMGANAGLGFLINRGMAGSDTALILIGMISIGVLGALLSTFATYLERIVCPWLRHVN